MSRARWVGLASIRYGTKALSTQGAYMPSTFTKIDGITENSAGLVIDMPDIKDLFTEDSRFPDVSLPVGGRSIRLEFATKDTNLTNFALAFEGTSAGTVYSAPTSEDNLREYAIRAVTQPINGTHFEVDIPNGSLRAGANLMLRNNDPEEGELTFSIGVQRAVSSGGTVVAPFRIRRC